MKKKITKTAALVGILGVTLWIGASREGRAISSCEFLNGRACSSEGSEQTCRWTDTSFTSVCTCSGGHWWC